jgi:FixJ family two-component response regulator
VESDAIVFIVAGNVQARRSLTARVKALGLPVKACHSAAEFCARGASAAGGCILLDVSQAAVDLELLERLGPREGRLPVVAISEQADVATAVRAMKLGAADFLEAQCLERRLAEAIEEALRWEAAHRRQIALVERIRRRKAKLAPAYREVLDMVVAGKSNRQIADELELSVRAIEERRAKVMRTMRARSLAELVRMAVTGEGSS